MASSIVKTTDHINRQFIDRTNVISTIRMSSVKVKTLPSTVKVVSVNLSNVLIVGHPIYGFVNVYPVFTPGSFSEVVSRVVNTNNVFVERFVHTDFVDSSNTTASVVSEVGVSFSPGDVFQSECFAKNNTVYSSYDYSLEGVNVDFLSTSTINDGVGGLKVLFTASSSCSLSKYSVVYS